MNESGNFPASATASTVRCLAITNVADTSTVASPDYLNDVLLNALITHIEVSYKAFIRIYTLFRKLSAALRVEDRDKLNFGVCDCYVTTNWELTFLN